MSPAETNTATRREIQVEIPADIVSRETEKVIQKMQKVARLPGFRRGKVPSTVIKQRFAEEIKSEVVESLIPRYFQQEAEKQKLVPVSQPRVTDLHIADGEPLRFKASFEVLPEIEVSGYHELTVAKPDTAVSEQEVEEQLGRLREQQATYTAIEGRAIENGDYAQVSLEGIPKPARSAEDTPARADVVLDGPPKPVKVDDVMVEVGGANTVREFSDNLRGARPGEQRTFDVSYPADFTDQRLAGKTFEYTLALKAIKQKHLPELNDDFAKELGGEINSLDELKQKIREGLEHEKQHAAEREGKEKILDELVKRHDFPVPEALVDRQIDVRLERGLRALAAQGMRSEDMKKMDFNRLRAGQKEAAEREVKASLLLDKIADAEHIEVSDEEIDHEVQALATQTKQSPDAVRARLTREGALDRIRNRLRNDKALDYLYRRPA
ncbi:MAG TPA: trigger factor [Terriglobales bacterium]